MYESLVCFIDRLKEDSIGEFIIDTENDGTPEHPIQIPYVTYSQIVNQFVDAVYSFNNNHPEYELYRYHSVLERYGITSIFDVDISKIDGKGIMALIMTVIRSERFCEGALKNAFENGYIEKWLYRLKELDESKVNS